jgi:hypothetical protein
MRRDTTSSVQSFADDILREVVDSESLEKTAAEAKRLDFRTESAKLLVKTAQDLRAIATSDPEISYDDMNVFLEKTAGIMDRVKSVAGQASNLYKNIDKKPGNFSSFGILDNLRKQNAGELVGKVGTAVKDAATDKAIEAGKTFGAKAINYAADKAKTMNISPEAKTKAMDFGKSVLGKLKERS